MIDPVEQSPQITPIIISTDREGVYLRQFAIEDAESMFELIDRNREHLSQFGDDTGQKYPDLASVQRSITHPKNPKRLRFGIWDNGGMVGSINLTPQEDNPSRAEIGYYMAEEYTRRGYATTALKALIGYAFRSAGLSEVFASIHKDNEASKKTAVKAGFQLTGEDEGREIFTLVTPNL